MKRITINCDSRDLEDGVLHLKNRISNIRKFRILSAEIPNSCYVVPPDQKLTITALGSDQPLSIPAFHFLDPVPSINDYYTLNSEGRRIPLDISLGTDSILGFNGGSFNPLGIQAYKVLLDVGMSRLVFTSPSNQFTIQSSDRELCDCIGIEPDTIYQSTTEARPIHVPGIEDRYQLVCPKMIDFNALAYIYLDVEELRPFMKFNAATSRQNPADDSYLLRIQMNSDFGKYSFYSEPSSSVPFVNVTTPLDLDKLTISLRKWRGDIADLNGLSYSFQLELLID